MALDAGPPPAPQPTKARKTEALLFHNRQSVLPPTCDLCITLGDVKIKVRTSGSIRILGVPLDIHLSFHDFVADKRRSTYQQLRMLSAIRDKIPLSHAKLLANAVCLSKIDYCNVLLVNCTQDRLDLLQRTLNHIARVVLRARRREPAVPLLARLDWPTIAVRIIRKQLLTVFLSLHAGMPDYLCKDVAIHRPPRPLHSGSRLDLSILYASRRVGNAAFRVWAGPIWNRLPLAIRNETSLTVFISLLDHHLLSEL